MTKQLLTTSDFKKIILEKTPIIDVRAPIEFLEGSLTGSMNLPIMNNEERTQVGTAYKKHGSDVAIELGNKLVNEIIRQQRIQKWCEYITENPNAVVTCFRGGLRSKIAQEWISVAGIARPRIEGGYKSFRNYLIEETSRLSKVNHLLVVGGATGSGKTALLREIQNQKTILDLEKTANHRGSAFGAFASPQPNQTNFENQLAYDLIGIESRLLHAEQSILVEDESRLVGTCAIPSSYFALLRSSPLVIIEESLEIRTENTYQEYVLGTGFQHDLMFEKFKDATKRISNRLGGLRAQEILKNIEDSAQEFLDSGSLERNKIWIQKLLAWYYDPMYLDSMEKRDPKVIFRGTREELKKYLLPSS